MRTVYGRLNSLEKTVRNKLNKVIFAWGKPSKEQSEEAENTGARVICFRWMNEEENE